MLLPHMNPKLAVIIKILNIGCVLCYLKSHYIKQIINKYFFPHLSTRPLCLELSLCIECSTLVLSKSFVPEDPSHCCMPDWRQYPPAPRFLSGTRSIHFVKAGDKRKLVSVNKPGIRNTIYTPSSPPPLHRSTTEMTSILGINSS